MPSQESRQINAAKAKAEIQERKYFQEPLRNQISALTAIVSKPKNEVKNHFDSTGNAFRFTRDSVLRHFFKDPQKLDDGLFNDNTHLLTILAAHDCDEDDFKKGQPTVIIAGAVKSNRPTTLDNGDQVYEYLFSTDEAYPADEFPPIETIDDLDQSANPPAGINSILLRF